MKKIILKLVSNKRKLKNLGFSLVEVLLAVCLLAIVVTPLMQVIITSMTMNKKSRELMAATNCAQSLMEYLESKPFDGAGNLYEEFNGASGTINIKCLNQTFTVEDMGSYNPAAWPTPYDSFKMQCVLIDYTNLSVAGIPDSDRLFINCPSDPDNRNYYAITGITYEGYRFDVYFSFTPTSQTTSDEYVVYDVNVDVYGEDKDAVYAHHSIDRQLVSLHGSTINKYQ